MGPACYNPNNMSIKENGRIVDFQQNKILRMVFEPNITKENTLPNKENPGPGQYEIQSPKEKKNFNV